MKGELRIGDRFEVTNEVRTTFGRYASQKYIEGLVTKIASNIILISTEKNKNTWISPHNFRLKDDL